MQKIQLLFFAILLICFNYGSSIESKGTNEHNDETANMHDFSHFMVGDAHTDRGPKSKINPKEKENDFWLNSAKQWLEHRTQHLHPNTKKAKNIILFLGDGMGVSTQTAARIYQGQLRGENGEENSLVFETMPYSGVSKTYCVDAQVADSACTSTAYTNGVKGSIGTMGLNAKVSLGDCATSKNSSTHTQSIVEWAIAAGKATGLVTTTRVTHASPGGLYSHIADRDWECDTDRPKEVDCQDIASQLIKNGPGNKMNVILGGGLAKFTLKSQGGKREDEDLLALYRANRETAKESYKIVKTKHELANVSASTTDFVLGLFTPQHMSYELKRSKTEEPSLTEMVTKAVEILSKNKNGFYLFVEGGKIDQAHHYNKAKKAITETIEFDNAIKQAMNMTNPDETLIVVTADHSHTFTIAGYPERGTPILEKCKYGGHYFQGQDDQPYLTLGYTNGPGYEPQRKNLTNEKTDEDDYVFPTGIPLTYETHGGEDVLVFSKGPWAHLLVGSFEQNYIPVAMAYAARIGPGADVPMVSSGHTMSGNVISTLVLSLLTLLVCRYLKDE